MLRAERMQVTARAARSPQPLQLFSGQIFDSAYPLSPRRLLPAKQTAPMMVKRFLLPKRF